MTGQPAVTVSRTLLNTAACSAVDRQTREIEEDIPRVRVDETSSWRKAPASVLWTSRH